MSTSLPTVEARPEIKRLEIDPKTGLPIPDAELLRYGAAWVRKQDDIMWEVMGDPYSESEEYFCPWNQSDWIADTPCGTSYCFAGFIGAVIDERFTESGKRFWKGWILADDNTPTVHVSSVAKWALGITEYESEILFQATNSASTIEATVENILTGMYRR